MTVKRVCTALCYGDISQRHFVFVSLDLIRCTFGGTLPHLPSPPVKDKLEGGDQSMKSLKSL